VAAWSGWKFVAVACLAGACGGQSETLSQASPPHEQRDAGDASAVPAGGSSGSAGSSSGGTPGGAGGSGPAAGAGGGSSGSSGSSGGARPDGGGGSGAAPSEDPGLQDARATWRDPEPPPQFPNQHWSNTPCPLLAQVGTAGCAEPGKACDYPVCWGAGNQTWVCVESRWRFWFDESFKCAPERPCPGALAPKGSACSPGPSCYYPIDCCGRVAGYTEGVCRGERWDHHITFRPDECPLCSPFPSQGQACSLESACKSDPPAVCYRPTCYGGTDVARCDGTRWRIEVGCQK
jgi:hypothetical protein